MRSRVATLRRRALALACASIALACGNSDRPRRFAEPRLVVESGASAALSLEPGQSLSIEAAGAGLGAAVWLHLWDSEAKTEVARGEPGWFGLKTTLAYRNPHSAKRELRLLVETDTAEPIRVDLLRDGRSWLRRIAPAVRLTLPHGPGYAVQVASVPGGAREAILFGLDCDGRLRAVDRASGRTGLPRLEGDVCAAVLVAPESSLQRTAAERTLSLYVNDSDDRDGDGLGRSLERALRTCDGSAEPGCSRGVLAEYYRGRDATRDSDRDGVSDGDEVLGAGPRLDFPRYGASPRHKDVFIEVDYDVRAPELGMRESDFAEVAALYAVGTASELRNPDGKPGVRLHFDVGFEPADPAHRDLVGDWGGSGRAAANNYRAARGGDFSPERVGSFRYAFLTRGGRGQARGDAITVNRDLNRVAIFAHELGHTLGLEHNGRPEWGKSNCKPNYYSLMNYVYQNRSGVGFSRRAGIALDPAAAWETIAAEDGLSAEALREPPLEFDVADGGIDWNRDGLISREPVRAGLSWATYKSCGSAAFARTTLAEGAFAASPVLARLNDRLYALYVIEGEVRVRHSPVSGPDAGGSCPEGDGPDTKCATWSLETSVRGIAPVQQMAALAIDPGEILFGYASRDGQLRLAHLAVQGDVLDVRSDVEIRGARSEFAPALARFSAEPRVRVFYRGERELRQASAASPRGPFENSVVRDSVGVPIELGLAPTVSLLGTGEWCGAFPDAERYVRFYCYDERGEAWRDLTRTAFFSGLGPQTAGPVGIAYHRYRLASGALVTGDATRGAVYLSFTEPESQWAKNPDNPHYFISEWLSSENPAARGLYFRWRGSVIDEWTNLAAGTSLALYEDERLSALKGLMLARLTNPESVRVDFLPFADGTHEDFLGSGNDFEAMERGICEGLRGEAVCSPER